MPILPIPDYRPDVSDYEGAHSNTILNVIPRGDGYGPFPDFTVFTSALPAACRGFFYARKADGSISVFAGTSTKLYNLNNTDFAWTDVSKSGGTYSALPGSDQWQFAQFNNFVFAVQINTAVQVFDLTSSSAFADLGGSPPPARYIAVVGRFLVLSGLGSSTPYRIQWSGLNATTTWTPGSNQSDYQDFPDGGIVRGVAGGEYGIVFQDASIRRLTYAPGSPVIFQIDRISEEKGIFAPLSMVRAGDQVLYISPDGFQMIAPGGYPQAIGKERVDRTFFADVDTGNLQLCIGASDPKGSRVYWAYKSLAGASRLVRQDPLLQLGAGPLVAHCDGRRVSHHAGEAGRDPGEPRCGLRLARRLDVLARRCLDRLAVAIVGRERRPQARLLHRRQSRGDHGHCREGRRRQAHLRARLPADHRCGDRLRLGVEARDRPGDPSYSDETLVNAIGMCPQRVSTRYARQDPHPGRHQLELRARHRARRGDRGRAMSLI